MANPFKLGESIKVSQPVKNPTTKQYYDPTTSIQMNVYDPHNGAELVNQDMTKDDTGKYSYHYTVPEDGTTGTWRVVVVVIDGSIKAKATYKFNVTA